MIPMTLGLDAMRQMLFPDLLEFALLDPYLELYILFGLAAFFIWLAKASLATLERIAKQEGRLTLRHQ
jgi:ABC-2 type transport system permease protein